MILRFLPLLNRFVVSHVDALREKLSRSAEEVSVDSGQSLSGIWKKFDDPAKHQVIALDGMVRPRSDA
jgi:hypothetical protein